MTEVLYKCSTDPENPEKSIFVDTDRIRKSPRAAKMFLEKLADMFGPSQASGEPGKAQVKCINCHETCPIHIAVGLAQRVIKDANRKENTSDETSDQ